MKFVMKFDMGNAAFGKEPNTGVIDILEDVSMELAGGCNKGGSPFDSNGNTIGFWKIKGKHK